MQINAMQFSNTQDIPMQSDSPIETELACAAQHDLADARMPSGIAGRATQRGFTLVEILVVLAIIGLIIGGVAVVAGGAFSGAQSDTAKNEVVALEGAVDMYKVKNKGKCPKNQQDLKTAGVVKKVKKDPWGKLYEIKCPGEHGDIDVMSAGPDGDFGTPDDINSWDEGSEEGEEKKK